VNAWVWAGVGIGAVVALWVALVALLAVLGRGRDARDVARFIPDCVVLFKRLFRDSRVPRRAKVSLALLIPYLASPIDLIPDFIPVLGHVDDAFLVALTLRYVVRRAGPEVVEELWPGSERGLRAVTALARSRE
jgi:uncharacterized membrane protein YkvA (DUF1232 family)